MAIFFALALNASLAQLAPRLPGPKRCHALLTTAIKASLRAMASVLVPGVRRYQGRCNLGICAQTEIAIRRRAPVTVFVIWRWVSALARAVQVHA